MSAQLSHRVAIGLPVHNGARFLAEALDSLLAQSFTDYEILISDNASTDDTPALAAHYVKRDSRIRYHRHPENLGAARNFNYCFENTSGELFKWAACDDRLAPTFLGRCIEVLDTRPEVALAATAAVEIDGEGRYHTEYRFPMRTDDASQLVRLRDLVLVKHPCTLVFGVARREVLSATRLIGSYVSADRVLLAEIALHGRVIEIPEPLFERRVHADNSILLDKRGSMLAWFDPRQSTTINLPAWRLVGELTRAVLAAPLDSHLRRSCLRIVAAHAWARRQDLRSDIRFAVRKRLARVPFVRTTTAQLRGPGPSA